MTPPTLTRRLLLIRLAKLLPQFPPELLKAASEELIASLAGGLVSGSPVILRGFGRLQLRRYQNSRKKTGLIFRPSPALIRRLNFSDSHHSIIAQAQLAFAGAAKDFGVFNDEDVQSLVDAVRYEL